MPNLLDRLHIHHAAPEQLPETPTRVPESPEVVEHGRRATTPPAGAAKRVRWLRWVALIVLAGGGAVALAMLTSDSGTDVTSDWPNATEGPGGYSMGPVGGPAVINAQPNATEGPGGYSMGPVSVPAVINAPRTADGAEGWIESLRIPPTVPRTADGAEHWIQYLRIPPTVPRTADGAEHWIQSVEARTVQLDPIIADLEANSENGLTIATPPSVDQIVADLEANSENGLTT